MQEHHNNGPVDPNIDQCESDVSSMHMGIATSTPEKSSHFYRDFFPSNLESLPSPITLDQTCSRTHQVLSVIDKQQLQQGDWLTDKHANAFNKLLLHQFPAQNGFQCPLIVMEFL